MSDDDENHVADNVIVFPGNKKTSPNKPVEEDTLDEFREYSEAKISVTKDSITRLIKALSTIHMATTYRARKVQACKDNIYNANFPCKLNCACYVNICAAMGLESFLGGPTQEEATLLVDAEHDLILSVYKTLYDEDNDPDGEE